MNVLQMQFLDVSVKVGIVERVQARRASGKEKERDGIAGEVCDSIIHNMQFIM